MTAVISIIIATFVSEDLTCISVGLLVQEGELTFATGLAGCYLGIVIGDLGLWALGRILGQTVLRWPRVRRHLPVHRIDALAASGPALAAGGPALAAGGPALAGWFDRRGWQAVIVARFVPGTRFPVYIAAGALGGRVRRFLLWAVLAAAVWTPLLVGAVALAGNWIVPLLTGWLGSGWIALSLAAILLFVVYRIAMLMGTHQGRARLKAAVARVWRWEFWPPWVFYLPVLPWIAYLATRYRGLTVPTAANPGIPHGGIVGESKYDILRRLPPEWVVRSERIAAGPLESRLARFRSLFNSPNWAFPVIFKPDVGERGAGLKLIRGFDEAAAYLRTIHDAVLVQEYHPGPFEAGIFYYRIPGEPSGRIFSITDKHFPILVGDGRSTVEELIWNHPRFRMQARTFLARLNGRSRDVPAPGEELRLAVAGNHCQGTLFRDGAHLLAAELERTVDRIAKGFDGFFVGRFDVRYCDVDAFRAGRDLTIIELNGTMSESTNIYDPDWPLWRAYRTLFHQWSILFDIGHRNRQAHHAVTPVRTLVGVIRSHYRARRVPALAD